jgi:hypothetical protein
MSRKLEFELMHRITKLAIEGVLSAGYHVCFDHDSDWKDETYWIKSPDDIDAKMEEIFACDQEHLYVVRPGDRPQDYTGWVFLIFSNEPESVISDYTTNLEDALGAANKFADQYA